MGVKRKGDIWFQVNGTFGYAGQRSNRTTADLLLGRYERRTEVPDL